MRAKTLMNIMCQNKSTVFAGPLPDGDNDLIGTHCATMSPEISQVFVHSTASCRLKSAVRRGGIISLNYTRSYSLLIVLLLFHCILQAENGADNLFIEATPGVDVILNFDIHSDYSDEVCSQSDIIPVTEVTEPVGLGVDYLIDRSASNCNVPSLAQSSDICSDYTDGFPAYDVRADPELSNAEATPIADISELYDLTTFSDPTLVATWGMDLCDLNDTGLGQVANFDEFIAATSNLSCANVSASNLYRESGGHSCIDQILPFGVRNPAVCGAVGGPGIFFNWQDDNPYAFRFEINFTSTNGELNRFDELTFDYYGSHNENDPFRWGIRILKNNVEIYQEIDFVIDPLLLGSQFLVFSRDFTNNPAFISSGNAQYEVEIMWYNAAGDTGNEPMIFDIDDIEIYGSCGSCAVATTNPHIMYYSPKG